MLNANMRTIGNRRSISGFSLVEMMVGMVVGMIVIGAVLVLVMAIIQSNNQTIKATRLTQELRATAALITSEVQRAGSATNPFNLVAAPALGVVDTSTAGCILFSYGDLSGSTVNRAISLSGGAIYMGTTACGSSGTQLSSDNVAISALTFSRSGRRIDVTLTGTLPEDPSIARSYTQSVFAPGLGT